MKELLPPFLRKKTFMAALADLRRRRYDLPIERLADALRPERIYLTALDALAEHLGAPVWDPAWPVATKRRMLWQLPAWQRDERGTPAGMERFLADLGCQVEVQHWYECEPRKQRGTMVAFVDAEAYQDGAQVVSRSGEPVPAPALTEGTLTLIDEALDKTRPWSRPVERINRARAQKGLHLSAAARPVARLSLLATLKRGVTATSETHLLAAARPVARIYLEAKCR